MSSCALETPSKKARLSKAIVSSAVKGKPTGNKQQAMVKEGQGTLVQELVDGLQEDLQNDIDILPVYNFYRKFKKICAEYKDCGEDAMWKDLSTMKGVDESFTIQWLEKHSDLTYDDLLEIQQNQNPYLAILLQYAVQVHRKIMLPESLRRQVVMMKFLDHRDFACGRRLATFKKDGGFASKRVDKDILIGYTIIGEANSYATEIVHKSTGDRVELSADDGLKVGVKIENPHEDFHAYFTRPPKQQVKLADFFEGKTDASGRPLGPFKQENYQGKKYKNLALDVAKLAASHADAVSQAKGSVSLEDDVAKKIAKAQDDKHAEQMKKAREAAAKAMEKAKADCAITLNAPPKASKPTAP